LGTALADVWVAAMQVQGTVAEAKETSVCAPERVAADASAIPPWGGKSERPLAAWLEVASVD